MEQERQLKPSWQQVKFNDVVKTSTAHCSDPTSRLQQYLGDQRYKALSERLESFKERHEQKQLLNVASLRNRSIQPTNFSKQRKTHHLKKPRIAVRLH